MQLASRFQPPRMSTAHREQPPNQRTDTVAQARHSPRPVPSAGQAYAMHLSTGNASQAAAAVQAGSGSVPNQAGRQSASNPAHTSRA